MFRKFTFSVLFIVSYVAYAEIITDGTLGDHVHLQAPHYAITQNLGTQVGPNLFHSFEQFNLYPGETATFSGDATIQHVISRITGGQPSTINGLIRSTIPNAELFLLNPAGMIFGEHAQLDIQGGFHASTADYMRFGENGRFNAKHPSDTLLTVAPPMAFGFLTTPSAIQNQGSQLIVASETDLSIVGGQLTLEDAQLVAASGRINLVSVASRGEVTAKISPLGVRIPDTSSFSTLGQIMMKDSSIETSGLPSGGILIHGGQLVMENSLIHAHNFGEEPGKEINIELSDRMLMRSDSLETSYQQHADNHTDDTFGIISDTFGRGKAGRITIAVPHLEMQHNTIDASTRGAGDGGNIDIQTQQMHLKEGAEIIGNVYDTGQGGEINIIATEQITLTDQRIFETEEEAINNQKTWIQTNTFGKGHGGNITIDTTHLALFGSHIFSNTDAQGNGGIISINASYMETVGGSIITSAVLPKSTGNGGKVTLHIMDTLKSSGFKPGWTHDGSILAHNAQTGIGPITIGKGYSGLLEIIAKNLIISDYATAGSFSVGEGHAGSVTINVDHLYLQNGGSLVNSSGAIIGGELWLSTGNSGHINVVAKQDITIEGKNPFNPSTIVTNTFLSGHGGSIDLQTNCLIVRDGGSISANSLGTGNAGNIHITANEIHLSQGGEITSAALQSIGGNLHIAVDTLLDIDNSQITTSAHGGTGNGGNILIENPLFSVLNQSQIIAQADAGHGGNIHVVANNFLKTPDSIVNASSKLGIDGHVEIASPDETISGDLLQLSSGFGQQTYHIRKCRTRNYSERSHFTIKHIVVPINPEDLRSSFSF